MTSLVKEVERKVLTQPHLEVLASGPQTHDSKRDMTGLYNIGSAPRHSLPSQDLVGLVTRELHQLTLMYT